LIFGHVPDLKASVLRSAEDGGLLWSEWEMTGTTTAGAGDLARGVAILRIEDDRVTWARFYLDPVEEESGAA
jgi:SnoaL-like domain